MAFTFHGIPNDLVDFNVKTNTAYEFIPNGATANTQKIQTVVAQYTTSTQQLTPHWANFVSIYAVSGGGGGGGGGGGNTNNSGNQDQNYGGGGGAGGSGVPVYIARADISRVPGDTVLVLNIEPEGNNGGGGGSGRHQNGSDSGEPGLTGETISLRIVHISTNQEILKLQVEGGMGGLGGGSSSGQVNGNGSSGGTGGYASNPLVQGFDSGDFTYTGYPGGGGNGQTQGYIDSRGVILPYFITNFNIDTFNYDYGLGGNGGNGGFGRYGNGGNGDSGTGAFVRICYFGD